MNKNTLYRIFVVSLILLVSLSPLTVLDVKAQEENTWTSLAPMPTPREGLGLAVVNNKIYAIGGKIGDTVLDTNEMYNPSTNTWTTLTPIPTPRANFAITTHQNKIYVIAGKNELYSPFINTIEVYDTITDTWEIMDSEEIKTLAYLNAHTVDDKLFVIAGTSSPFPTGGYSYDNYYYSLLSKYWSTKAPILHAVSFYASVAIDEKIYVIGGQSMHPSPYINNFTQIYDPVLDKWDLGVPMPTGERVIYGAVTSGVQAPKRIHVFGPSLHYVFDFETNIWTSESLLPSYRDRFQVAVINDFIYVMGGRDQNKNVIATNEVYTPLEHKLTYSVPSPTPTITPTPTISPTPTIEPTNSPTSSPEPTDTEFPVFIVASIIIIAVVSIVILVYGAKTKRRS